MSKLRELRKKRGLSISKTSQQSSVNASALSWIELGKVVASPMTRASLAKFYGEKEDTLFHPSGIAK